MSYNKTRCLTGATPQSFATMEYSLRIYKNEYGVRHLNFIRKKFEVTGETEKTLEVVGKEQDLEMLMSAMFLTDEQFKAVFPDYQTEKECQEWTRKELADLEDTIARTLLPHHLRRRHEQPLVCEVPFFLFERIDNFWKQMSYYKIQTP